MRLTCVSKAMSEKKKKKNVQKLMVDNHKDFVKFGDCQLAVAPLDAVDANPPRPLPAQCVTKVSSLESSLATIGYHSVFAP